MKSIQKKNGVFIPESIRRKAIEARAFLSDHPALGNIREHRLDPNETITWHSVELCKRGYSVLDPISIEYTEKNYKKYKADFDKKYTPEQLDDYSYIYKGYKDVFGEPWKFHHVLYTWEVAFYVYFGDVSRKSKDWLDYKKWQAYSFKVGNAPTLEECYIQAANLVKKDLGDFNIFESFHTEVEKENHKVEKMYINVKCKHKINNPFSGKFEAGYLLKENSKHLKVHDGMVNRRWLQWFIKNSEYPFAKNVIDLANIQPPTE